MFSCRQFFLTGTLTLLGLVSHGVTADFICAQILPDTTLGSESSIISPEGRIEGGAIRNSSLFHSFSDFSIADGEQIYFVNPPGVQTLFSRVTGMDASYILGTLGVDGPASLFFLNPNGIVFGPNAELDITGSFMATTAELFTFPRGETFSAINPEAPPLLTVNVTPGLQYGETEVQPLVSDANLAVGQNLVLSGGSVISNGQLSAGQRITVEGVADDVQVQDVTAHTASISANGNLLLNGSQLETIENLTLQATENIEIQDGIEDPFIAAAGVDLILEAEQGIDTTDLSDLEEDNSLDSQLSAGRDLVLRTPGLQLGNRPDPENALYSVGSYFRTEDLEGTVIDLWIPYENAQVVRANADIEVGQNYFGSSLYILAGGGVSVKEGIDRSSISIRDTERGSVVVRFPNGENITLQSTKQGTLDVRAGVGLFSEALFESTNLPLVNTSVFGVEAVGAPTNANIILGTLHDRGGNVGSNITNGQGTVSLSNNGSNTSILETELERLSGDIILDSITTSFSVSGDGDRLVDGGGITLDASRDIIVNGILRSDVTSISGNVGNGGRINLLADGNITTNRHLTAVSDGNSSNAGDGGVINFVAGNDISTNRFLSVESIADEGDSGNGGTIIFLAGGNIATDAPIGARSSLTANTESRFGNTGNGGTIIFSAGNTINANTSLVSRSRTTFGSAGDGGIITLLADEDINASKLNLVSSSSESNTGNAGNGGIINVLAGNDISSSSITSVSLAGSGDTRNGGTIILSAIGDINTNASNFINVGSGSDGNTGNGGTITFLAGNNISSGSSLSASSQAGTSFLGRTSGKGGDGGSIVLLANNDIVIDQSLDSRASARSGDTGNSGIINISAGGAITANSSLSTLSAGGDGGTITLSADDNIVVDDLNSSSLSRVGDSGDAGKIVLTSGSDIIVGDLEAYSFSETDNSGSGGVILLVAREGSIQGDNSQLSTFSITVERGITGPGGTVTLEAQNTLSGLEVSTLSSSAQSGTVQIEGNGSLVINDTRLVTSAQLEIIDPIFTARSISLNIDDIGQSGNTRITGSNDLTFNNVDILSNALGSNPAGDVTIISPEQIVFNNSQFVSDSDSMESTAQGGSLIIQASEVTLNNSELSSETSGASPAGNITITTPTLTIDNESTLETSTSSMGDAGDIILNADILNMLRGARVLAATDGTGNGGTITVNAPTAVNLGLGVQDFAPILSVETSDAGKAGDIIINTPNFTLSETARITATATDTATNLDGGGSITLNADQMNLAGIVGIFAETEGQAPGGVLTLQPYQHHQTLDVALAPGAVISASTISNGRGGNLQVLAPEAITISGPGQLAVETIGSGRAGNIEMATRNLTLTDVVTISASTQGSGQAGTITLNGENITISDGAQVQTNTFDSQNAGNIKFNVTDTLEIDNGLVESSTEPGSTGNGGNIIIDPLETIIRNDGRIAVISQGEGTGGNIDLTSDRLILSNHGEIIAETLSSDGGNIILNLQDVLLMRHNSLISTSAGTAEAGGDGGNITVNVPNGFIVGVPDENSDIAADAFEGNGGNVNISAQNILGLEFRDKRTPLSDITASSEFGLDGNVNLDTLNIDPSQGLLELPANLVDRSNQIAQRCLADSGDGQSAFVVTGRSGVPPTPGEVVSEPIGLLDFEIYEDTQLPANIIADGSDNTPETQAIETASSTIEAQSWLVNEVGEVELVAQVANPATQLSSANSACPAS